MTASTTLDRTGFDTDVELRRDDEDLDYSGWFCIRTRPFPCPAAGCDFVAYFQTAAHLIVVWPSLDDSALLANAHNLKVVGRDPRPVEYEPDFGFCIPYDLWRRIGSPVHGRLEKPDGYDERARDRL